MKKVVKIYNEMDGESYYLYSIMEREDETLIKYAKELILICGYEGLSDWLISKRLVLTQNFQEGRFYIIKIIKERF